MKNCVRDLLAQATVLVFVVAAVETLSLGIIGDYVQFTLYALFIFAATLRTGYFALIENTR